MISDLSINTIRVLGIDAINKANSGHPGIVLGAAPMAYTLWTKHLDVYPKDPFWFNRDRFVLAAGHGSMLLYAMLHLTGFDITIDDIKNFRQLGSKTPGHPEFMHTPGVDATSGPLGQGIPMAIGMALSEKYFATKYNRPNLTLIDHYTYVICGDGDLMEGVTNEAMSLAGHLGLGKLIVLYDSNSISLDGKTDQTFTENAKEKYEAMGWQYFRVDDGNDITTINVALRNAKNTLNKPSIIEIKTTIGYGSPLQGTHKVHGSPLGEAGGQAAKKSYKWVNDPFTIPSEVYDHFKETTVKRGCVEYKEWQQNLKIYEENYPLEYQELMTAINNGISVDLKEVLPNFPMGESNATRNASYECLNKIAPVVTNLIGGAADLTSSTKAIIKNAEALTIENYTGRNIYFGVREFAMASIANGVALHGGLRIFVSTFFVFSDYFKAAIRMAALMKLPVIYILTHDSIAVGEDGPTHQPIEQLAMLRSIPNIQVLRPCDSNETAACYSLALTTLDKPTVLVLTRQNVETITNNVYDAVTKGAYIVSDSDNPQGIIIATGSEVSLAIHAQTELNKENISVRVVSMVSMELFNAQSKEYIENVLPNTIRNRMAIEMGSTFGWHRYVGLDGIVLGIDTFGDSGKPEDVMAKFGFTVENVVKQYKTMINKD